MRVALQLTTIAVLLSPSVGVSQTTLPCPLLVNETLLLSESPYLLECDLDLENVIIEPGVRIEATGNFELRVLGGLTAVGTPSQPIVFTAVDDSTDWQGIFFDDSTAESELAHCLVENSVNSGIRISEASPIIQHCEIARNQARYGAGINISGSLPVTLEDCSISENFYSGANPKGGGIYTTSPLVLIRCKVQNNEIRDRPCGWSRNATTFGGGVYAESTVVLNNVVLTGNIASACGGAEKSWGGGVYADGDLVAHNCTIANNAAGAGGINASGGARGYGGGICCKSTIELKNCIVTNNATRDSSVANQGKGGGVYAADGVIENCTIACGNRPYGVYFVGGGSIVNSILWGNTRYGTPYQHNGVASVTYSCVEGIAAGDGNISGDPMLPACDPAAPENLRIPCVSPCVDAGNPDPQYDDASSPPLCVPCGTTRNDMGAHGGLGGCGFTIIGEEGFEELDTIFSYSSTHSIPYDVQNADAAHTGIYSFKAYTSTCGADCLDAYRVDLLHTFPESVRLIGVELWAREGSTTETALGGKIRVGHDSTWNLEWDVVDDGNPITGEWQHVFVPIDESATDVKIGIWDITSQSTMWLDDIVISYETEITLQPPVADAGGPYDVDALMDDVSLNATDSHDPDGVLGGFDDIVSLQWDLGNDGIEDDEGRTDPYEVISFDALLAKGLALGVDVPIGLNVVDADELEGSDADVIQYANSPPTADAGGPYGPVYPGTSVQLEGGIDDPDLFEDYPGVDVGEYLVVEWDITTAAEAGEIGDGFAGQPIVDVTYEELVPLYLEYGETLYLNVADASGSVTYSAATIELAMPNLTIGDLLDPMPTEGGTGRSITVGWAVTNTGEGLAQGAWQDCVYLSYDDAIGDDDLLDCMYNPIDLGVGESYERVGTFTVPVVVAGDYWIVVTSDDGNVLAETDESDNATIDGPFPVYETPCADLEPGGLVIPEQAVAGGPAGIDWIVTNVGEGPTDAALWRDRVYLSLNEELDGSDRMVGGFWNPMALNTDDSYPQIVQVTVPGDLPGDYYVIVKTDADASLSECDEDNNVVVSSRKMRIDASPDPSVAITSLQVAAPPSPYPGDPVTLTWAITNTSDFPIGPCEITHDLWLSEDGSLGGDRSLATNVSTIIIDLPPGGTSDPIAADVDLPRDVWGEKHVIVSPQAIDCAINTWPGVEPIEIQTPIVADLMIDEIGSPETGTSGESIVVSWTVHNDHNNTTFTDTWEDVVILSQDASLATTADNQELGSRAHTGALALNEFYEAALDVALPVSTDGPHHIFVCTDAANQVYEDEAGGEDNNCTDPQAIAVEYRAPDLQVENVVVVLADEPVLSGTMVTVSWGVTNAGDWATRANGWDDRIYISDDDVLDADDHALDTVWHAGPLAATEGYEVTHEVTIPLDFIAPTAYVLVCADESDQEYESDEDDNCTASKESFEVTSGAADLVILGIDVTVDGEPVSSVLSGSTITVDWQVHNNGPGATSTASWFDRIYISDDDVLDDSDGFIRTYAHTGFLAAENGYTATLDVTIPLDFIAPTTYVFVTTDHDNEVVEFNDDNNSTRNDDPFEVTWGAADLLVLTVDVTVDGAPISSVPSGSTVTVQWQVHNDGPGATSAASWSDRIYISDDDVLDTSSDLSLDTDTNSGVLAAEDGYTTTLDVTIPISFTAPTAYVFVTTDHDNEVVEFDDDNNSNRNDDSIVVVWGEPDLTVQSVSAVHGVPHGEVIDLSWTVRNLGGPTVVAEWRDALYLSTDRWISPDDQEMETPTGPLATHIGALDYDEIYSRTEPIAVPPGSPGYLIVVTDVSDPDQVVESDEANNDAYSALPSFDCDSDLIITEVDAPATAFSGQLMTVQWAVTNQGGQPTNTGEWRDAVYLSPDQYLDRDSDIYLGYLNHSGVLDAGTAYDPAAAFSGRVPAWATGPYYVFVVADSNDHVCETDEGNNIGRDDVAVQMELPPPADLVVIDIVVLAGGYVGDDVAIEWTVENQGEFEAQGTWHDSVYISADTTWDVGDPKIGKVQHLGPVAAGGDYVESLTAPIPGVVPDDYYIIVRTDIHNEVPESVEGEQNNITPSADRIEVQTTELTLGTPHAGTVTNGDVRYFRVCVAEDETLRVILDSDAASGLNELYVRFGQIADRGRYDVAYENPFSPNQTVVVPTTQAGCYYITLYCDHASGGSTGYTLLAESVPFGIDSVTPARIGDNGQVTLTLHGARFEPGVLVTLTSESTVLVPDEIIVLDGATMKARFLLADASHGFYDIEVENRDEATDAIPEAVTVEPATAIDTRLYVSGNLTPRVGRTLVAQGATVNLGNIDAPSVTVVLSFDQEVRVGWWRPAGALPREADYPDADWATESPTATFEGGGTLDAFFIRDLEPGKQIAFAARVTGFSAGPFRMNLKANAMSAAHFADKILSQLETARQQILEVDPATVPQFLRGLADDPLEWRAFFSDALTEYGLLQAGVTDISQRPRAGMQKGARNAACRDPVGYALCVNGYTRLLTGCLGGCALACLLGPLNPGCPLCAAGCTIAYALALLSCDEEYCLGSPPCGSNNRGWTNGQGCGNGQGSVDPNEKSGATGYGDAGFVGVQEPLPFTVYFENLPDATAWAAEIRVTDQVTSHLDWQTFQLGEIALGDTTIEVSDRRPHCYEEITLDNGLIVRINAGIDIEAGVASWALTAIDPETGEVPADSQVGLLPPNNPDLHDGEGHVTFMIRPRPDLPTGTEITNSATIIFDVNEPIETNEVFNTIDSGAPTSWVTAPAGEQPNSSFELLWTGEDDENGSGIGSYTSYYSLDGGPYVPWITTSETSAMFTDARGGGTYDFYSVATDNVGNTEAPPEKPDTTAMIALQIPFAPTAGMATATTIPLPDLGTANVGTVEHAVYVEEDGGDTGYVGADGLLQLEEEWLPLNDWGGVRIWQLTPETQYTIKAKARAPETEFGNTTTVTTSIRGDVDGDGLVTQADVDFVQIALGTTYGDEGFDARADLNGDDEVTFADLGIVLSHIREGDYNRDGYVTLDDYTDFYGCLTGPVSGALDSGCAQGDFDRDDDIDLLDFGAFQRVFGADGP